MIDREEEDYYVGRTEFDSPEIDNEVLIPKESKNLEIGCFYKALITAADNFDLYAEIEDWLESEVIFIIFAKPKKI